MDGPGRKIPIQGHNYRTEEWIVPGNSIFEQCHGSPANRPVYLTLCKRGSVEASQFFLSYSWEQHEFKQFKKQ